MSTGEHRRSAQLSELDARRAQQEESQNENKGTSEVAIENSGTEEGDFNQQRKEKGQDQICPRSGWRPRLHIRFRKCLLYFCQFFKLLIVHLLKALDFMLIVSLLWHLNITNTILFYPSSFQQRCILFFWCSKQF